MKRAAPAVVALAALAAWPAAAGAHARVQRAEPAPGAVLRAAPRVVELRFDEAVSHGRVEVVDRTGARIDRGRPFSPGGDGARLAVRLAPHLRDGSYALAWRAVSDDGHVEGGRWRFAVRRPGGAPVVHGVGTAPGVTLALGAVARMARDAAIALALGILAFSLLVWPGTPVEPFARRSRRLLRAAAGLGAISALALVVVQGAEDGDLRPWSPGVAREALGALSGRTGCVSGLAFLAWLAVLAATRRPRPERSVALLPAVGLIALSPVLCGHEGDGALLPLDVVHVIAVSAWLGGLAGLLAASGLVDVTRRFSRLALPCAVAALATGAGQALARLPSVPSLLDSPYGRLVAVKLLLFSALIAFGARNRYAIARGTAVRRAVGWELAFAAITLGAAGLLAGTAPPP